MIKLGTTNINTVALGSQTLSKVAVGSSVIWEDRDDWSYDLVDDHVYDEIDILYTTDVHGAWRGYDDYPAYGTTIFNYRDIRDYRNKLASQNIKALLVDGGDWSHGSESINDCKGSDAADQMNDANYFAVTYGNHEWKWENAEETIGILDRCNAMTACNLWDLMNKKLAYKPYRTAKIGGKKIAVIGVGYPSPNGRGGDYEDGKWYYEGYKIWDDDSLYSIVQGHINTFKANNFDYIIVLSHMCKSTYEDDDRYYARTDYLIKNTSGLDVVLQGHFNQKTNAELINDKGGHPVLLAHEAGAVMNCFGRLRFKNDGTIESSLITSRGEL